MEGVVEIFCTDRKRRSALQGLQSASVVRPRCGTALSSHELAQGYENVKDITITAKFGLVDGAETYFLAWTTTPWTLPGNIALAVGEEHKIRQI